MMTCESITILFYGKIEPLEIPTNTSCDLTCEEALCKCIEHVQPKVCVSGSQTNKAMFLPVFGLVKCPEKEMLLWLPHSHVFKKTSRKKREYMFRVRFRLLFDQLNDDSVLCEYLFLQVLHDFLMGPLGSSEELKEKDIFFLLAIALLFPGNLPFDGSKIVDHKFQERHFNIFNFTCLFSKNMKANLLNETLDRLWVPWMLKEQIKKFKMLDRPRSLQAYKQHFYQILMKAVPSYCLEKYQVKCVGKDEKKDTVTVTVDLHEESLQEPAIYYYRDFQCWMSDIEALKLNPPRNQDDRHWQVIIEMKAEVPKELLFDEREAAESFITMVQGYFSLYVRYDTCLNTDLRSVRMKISGDLKSFGPLLTKKAEAFLCEVKDTTTSVYLIHESVTDYGHYVMLWKHGQNSEGAHGDGYGRLDIKILAKGQLQLEGVSSAFNQANSLRKYLLQKYGQQILPRTSDAAVASINDMFRQEKIEDYQRFNDDVEQSSDKPGIYLREDLEVEAEIPDKNPLVRKFKVTILPTLKTAMYVVLQKDDGKISSSFLKGIEKLMTLGKIDQNRFLKFCGIVPQERLCFLMEYSPLSDLLTHIQNPLKIAQKVDIVHQILKILRILEENKINHGNLRLRRFMVFSSGSSNSIVIKLGDPGVSSYLDTLPMSSKDNVERLPWLSPERRKKLDDITYESECYAVGTAICELLYRNDDFAKELGLESQEKLVEDLVQGKHLRPPPILAQEEDDNCACAVQGEDGGSDDSSGHALLPAARQVLWSVWEQIVLRCWEENPTERPSSVKLIEYCNEIQENADEILKETLFERTKQVAYAMGLKEILKRASGEMNRPTLRQMEKMMRNTGMFLSGESIKTAESLGSGHFGVVYKGSIQSQDRPPQEVAVKMLMKSGSKPDNPQPPTDSERKCFIKEIIMAISLSHPNIVKIYYCSMPVFPGTKIRTDALVMELMDQSLIKFAAKPDKKFEVKDDQQHIKILKKISLDVVKGMVYLSGKEIVHRDLAARNVLLQKKADGQIIGKVSDFGLARDMEGNYKFYKLKGRDLCPLSCWPPECLVEVEARVMTSSVDAKSQCIGFTTKGDVWSFGTMLWEVFSKGQNSIRLLPKDVLAKKENEQKKTLYEKYEKGWRYPDEKLVDPTIYGLTAMYGLMKECWQMDPRKRPAFVDLEQRLEGLIKH